MEHIFHILGEIGSWLFNNADDILDLIPDRKEKLTPICELNQLYVQAYKQQIKLQ